MDAGSTARRTAPNPFNDPGVHPAVSASPPQDSGTKINVPDKESDPSAVTPPVNPSGTAPAEASTEAVSSTDQGDSRASEQARKTRAEAPKRRAAEETAAPEEAVADKPIADAPAKTIPTATEPTANPQDIDEILASEAGDEQIASDPIEEQGGSDPMIPWDTTGYTLATYDDQE